MFLFEGTGMDYIILILSNNYEDVLEFKLLSPHEEQICIMNLFCFVYFCVERLPGVMSSKTFKLPWYQVKIGLIFHVPSPPQLCKAKCGLFNRYKDY